MTVARDQISHGDAVVVAMIEKAAPQLARDRRVELTAHRDGNILRHLAVDHKAHRTSAGEILLTVALYRQALRQSLAQRLVHRAH